MDFIILHLGLDLTAIVFAVIILAIAGFIRGYSGFGFSAITATSLSLFLLPKEIIPIILFLKILASIHMLAKSWQQINCVIFNRNYSRSSNITGNHDILFPV